MSRQNRPNADPVEGPTLHIDDNLLLEALAAVERRSSPKRPSADLDDPEISVDVEPEEPEGAGGEILIESLSDDLVLSIEADGVGHSPAGDLFAVPDDLVEPEPGDEAWDDDRTDPSGFAPNPAAKPARPSSPVAPAPAGKGKSLLSDPKLLDKVSRLRKRAKGLQRRVAELETELDQERQASHLARSRSRIAENAKIEAEEHRDNIDRFARSLRARVLAQEEEIVRLQRRSSQELEHARRYGADNIIREMLPVLDNLGLALEHADTDPEKFVPGIRMVASLFLRSLERVGVLPIEASPGTPFDPAVHEAILTIPSAEHPEGSIAEEVRCGYTLHDRLLRASQVSVAGPPRRLAERILPVEKDDAAPATTSEGAEE